ncbi:MAG: YraN family protein [Nitrospirae bacterium]|nr:YraN family protein [Nitrospirota bacterium]
MSTANLMIGRYGEWVAARHLKRLGYSIIERNYRNTVGELDIIAKDGETIVFIEVKTRRSDDFGQPYESITYRKRQKILKTAQLYLQGLTSEPSVRFDIISVKLSDNKSIVGYQKTLEHKKDVFEL